MKKDRVVVRMDFPDFPPVQLPLYPRSCGRSTLPPGYTGSYAEIGAVELIWAITGRFIVEYQDPPQQLELKAGQSTLCLFNEKRSFRNIKSVAASYRWLCFDGLEAEKFIRSYDIPLRNALNSGECPEDLFNEVEALLLQYTPYAMRKCVSIITSVVALMIPHVASAETDIIFNFAISLVSRHYRSAHFNVNALAGTLNIHRTTLNRIFQDNMQKSPHEYLISYRLSRACSLLADSTLSVEEIAHTVGFARSNYFCRIFSRRYGMTPKNWRKTHHIYQ